MPLLIRLTTIIIVIIAGLTASFLYITADSTPTHPVLAKQLKSPLISVHSFYGSTSSTWDHIVSHDGSLVGYWESNSTNFSFTVRDVARGETVHKYKSLRGVVLWHPDKNLLWWFKDGKRFELDPQNPKVAARETTPKGLEKWHLSVLPRTSTEPFVVFGRRHLRSLDNIYLVNPDGSTSIKLTENDGKTLWWFLNEQNEVIGKSRSIDGHKFQLMRKDGETWETLFEYTLDDEFTPFSIKAKGTSALFWSARDRERIALVEFDFATGQERVIYNDPEDFVQIAYAFDQNRTIADLLKTEGKVPGIVALTKRGRAFKELAQAHGQSIAFEILGRSTDGRFMTVQLHPGGSSRLYRLFDLETGTDTPLGAHELYKYAQYFDETKIVHFAARDGLSIPVLLNRPKGVTGPIPFVVQIHGGPAQKDYWGYDRHKQFLTNRGYGVLSVNFRGSKGYGKAFQQAGFGEFGRAMQDDIADAARWLIETGQADPEAIAVMGASYGGYSAALAVMRDEGLFKAAIAEVPMLDVVFQSKHHPQAWALSIGSWHRYFGDYTDPDALKLMAEYSPVRRIKSLHAPMLVIGGEKDPITAIQQVHDFETAAQTFGKDVETHVFPSMGHGFYNWKDRIKRARLTEDFLAKHLGGRTGNTDFIEYRMNWID